VARHGWPRDRQRPESSPRPTAKAERRARRRWEGPYRRKASRVDEPPLLHGSFGGARDLGGLRILEKRGSSPPVRARARARRLRQRCQRLGRTGWGGKKTPPLSACDPPKRRGVVKRSIPRFDHESIGNPRDAGARIQRFGWQKSVVRISVVKGRRAARLAVAKGPSRKDTVAPTLTRTTVGRRRKGARVLRSNPKDSSKGTESAGRSPPAHDTMEDVLVRTHALPHGGAQRRSWPTR